MVQFLASPSSFFFATQHARGVKSTSRVHQKKYVTFYNIDLLCLPVIIMLPLVNNCDTSFTDVGGLSGRRIETTDSFLLYLLFVVEVVVVVVVAAVAVGVGVVEVTDDYYGTVLALGTNPPGFNLDQHYTSIDGQPI